MYIFGMDNHYNRLRENTQYKDWSLWWHAKKMKKEPSSKQALWQYTMKDTSFTAPHLASGV